MDDVRLKRSGASYWGIEQIDSRGKKRYQKGLMRGNGDLVLTNATVVFTRWVPRKEFCIPLDGIRAVELGRWHNRGSAVFQPILRIFYEEEGETHIFGVCVGWKKDALKWKAEIDRLREKT